MHMHFEVALRELHERGRLRTLSPRSGRDFTSNDYLALAESAELRRAAQEALARGVPIGAGGSRLLRGNHPEHEALESEAAAFFHADTALFFGGGFMANFALFATLPQRGDLVVYDELIHASVHQGMRSGRAQTVSVPHNDTQAFADVIRSWRTNGGTGRPWIAVESLYSMDGDRAPLADLMGIADRYEAMLVIDEAHATGVFGPDGRGLGAAFEGRQNVVTLHTCGKALGTFGALVCAPRPLRDFLVNRCRPFIYATAPSPLIAATVRAALGLCKNEPQRRERLARLVAHAGRELMARCRLTPSGSQILPVIVGTDARATALAAAMRRQGFDIRAIRPPTVPEGTARLRIALTLHADERGVSDMLEVLGTELAKLLP
jgi:8-amino-7-oxononanoate synthase